MHIPFRESVASVRIFFSGTPNFSFPAPNEIASEKVFRRNIIHRVSARERGIYAEKKIFDPQNALPLSGRGRRGRAAVLRWRGGRPAIQKRLRCASRRCKQKVLQRLLFCRILFPRLTVWGRGDPIRRKKGKRWRHLRPADTGSAAPPFPEKDVMIRRARA